MSRLQQGLCKCVLWYFAERLDKYEFDCRVIKMTYSCLSKPGFKRGAGGEWLLEGCQAFSSGGDSTLGLYYNNAAQRSDWTTKNHQSACLKMVKSGEPARLTQKKSCWFCSLWDTGSCVAHANLSCVRQPRVASAFWSFCHYLFSARDLTPAGLQARQASSQATELYSQPLPAFCFFVLRGRVSCSPGWPPTHCTARDDLDDLLIFLPLSPKFWDYRYKPSAITLSWIFNSKKAL